VVRLAALQVRARPSYLLRLQIALVLHFSSSERSLPFLSPTLLCGGEEFSYPVEPDGAWQHCCGVLLDRSLLSHNEREQQEQQQEQHRAEGDWQGENLCTRGLL
jgi:hypothetical protein